MNLIAVSGSVVVLIASVLVVTALTVMSLAFARRVRPDMRLPMQWGFDVQPTWYAPRAVALAFTPVLSAVVMMFIACMTNWVEGMRATDLVGISVAIGLAFLGAHAVHLGLISRWLQTQ